MDPNTSTNPAAPAGFDGGTPPAPVPAPMQGGDDGFVRVPRDVLAGFNGDYHEMVRVANEHKGLGDYASIAQELKEAGYSREDVVAFFNQQQGQGSEPAPPQGLTQEQLQQVLANERAATQKMLLEGLQSHTQQQEQMATRRQALNAGRELVNTSRDKFLEEVGLKMFDEADGKQVPNQMGHAIGLRFQDFIREATEARIPEDATPEQRQDMLYSPTAEDVAYANEQMAWARDAKYEAAAAVAQEQEPIPNATLGEGSGGQEPTTDVENMSYEQKKELVMSRVGLRDDD